MRHAARQLPSWLIFNVRQEMKIVQKRFGSSVTFEVANGNLVVEAKSLSSSGSSRIPLLFLEPEYSEHEERSRGWIAMAIITGLFAFGCVIGGLSVEAEAQGPPLGLAIIFALVSGLSFRSHVQRNVAGLLFARSDTGGVIFIQRDLPTRDEFETFVESLVSAIRDERKRPNKAPEPTPGAVTPRATEANPK